MSLLRPRILQRLDGMVARQQQLLAAAADPVVGQRPDRLASIQRELGSLQRVVEAYDGFRGLEQQIAEDEALLRPGGDAELAELARAELPQLRGRAEALAGTLVDLLLQEQGDDRRDCIVEIRAGTGGEEAALFARDLAGLYQRYANRMGWTIEVLHSAEADHGGYKEVTFAVRGDNVFHYLQFESGGHRVSFEAASQCSMLSSLKPRRAWACSVRKSSRS
jgi:peptide chain release factor 1